MNNYELLRCKNMLQKDNFTLISKVEKAIKSEIACAVAKYAEFEDKDVYFEMSENKGKIYLKFEANVKI